MSEVMERARVESESLGALGYALAQTGEEGLAEVASKAAMALFDAADALEEAEREKKVRLELGLYWRERCERAEVALDGLRTGGQEK